MYSTLNKIMNNKMMRNGIYSMGGDLAISVCHRMMFYCQISRMRRLGGVSSRFIGVSEEVSSYHDVFSNQSW